MGLLARQDVEDRQSWRAPYLERVIRCNLSKAERILRFLRLHAQARGLKPSPAEYRRRGRALRFSRFGHPRLEGFYSDHFIQLRGEEGGSGLNACPG